VLVVLGEGDRWIHLVRPRADSCLEPQLRERAHDAVEELRNRHRLHGDRAGATVARADEQLVTDEVELDVEGP
jgi:hypothetical protein